MQLYDLNHGKKGNRYCGPAVISFATGITTADAAKLIRDWSNRRNITGTTIQEIRYVLYQCGILTQDTCMPGKPTVAAWLKGSQQIRTPGRVYLLIAGSHWQLITEDQYACGRVGEITTVTDARVKRRARVTGVFELIPLDGHEEKLQKLKDRIQHNAEYEAHLKSARTKSRSATKRLAAKNGIDIEVDRLSSQSMLIYFLLPNEIEEARMAGELDFIGVAHDWEDAAETLDTMLEAITEWRERT